MDDKIVICGAGGFVGGRFIEYLLAQGHRDIRAISSRPTRFWLRHFPSLENYQLDLRDYESCQRALSGAKWIINLAAKVGGIGFIGKNKTECMLSSLVNTNLLRASGDEIRKGYFFASSACVYGSASGLISEDEVLQPSEGYGEEKVFSEAMCRAYAEEYSIPVRIARFTGIYGPGDDTKGALNKDHAPAALCRKFLAAKKEPRPHVTIWGNGMQTRDFVYIDDCVEAIYRLMNCDGNCHPVNVGNVDVTTVNNMVSILEKVSGIKVEREYDLNAPQGVQHRALDNTRLRTMTGWEPSIGIAEGLTCLYRDLESKTK